MLYFAAFLVFAGPLVAGWYFSDALLDTTYIANKRSKQKWHF